MNKIRICMLPGDGIGPEIMRQAEKVIKTVEDIYDLEIQIIKCKIGGAALDEFDTPLPEETINACFESDAILLGSVGGPKWDTFPPHKRPETGGLLELRKKLGLFANIRPVKICKSLESASPVSGKISDRGGIDLVTVRELSGGIYFGTPSSIDDSKGIDTMIYKRDDVVRICKVAFKIAECRKKKICSVDKANVLSSSQLWRNVVNDYSKNHPDIDLVHMYIDNAAMQMILDPSQFDVILTTNLFGDIISDESAALAGSLGMLPSASLGEKVNLFEPAGGSAPDIAGKNIANPIAQILSLAMMFEYSFGMHEISEVIRLAVENLLEKGIRTLDIYSGDSRPVSTNDFGELICEEIKIIKKNEII